MPTTTSFPQPRCLGHERGPGWSWHGLLRQCRCWYADVHSFNPAEPNERIDRSAIDANSLFGGNQAFVWKVLIANLLAFAVGELGSIGALAAGHFIL